MAAYIDLNPVRAGMVTDPADIRGAGEHDRVGSDYGQGIRRDVSLTRGISWGRIPGSRSLRGVSTGEEEVANPL